MKVFIDTNNKICSVNVPTSSQLKELVIPDYTFGNIPSHLVKCYYCYPSANEGELPRIQIDHDSIALVTQVTQYYSLDEVKEYMQNENKKNFSDFLKSTPLLWTDNKYYGVTQDDQLEMQTDLSTYNLKRSLGYSNWPLKWHDQKKSDRDFSVEEFNALLSAITDFVYPYRQRQAQIKQAIYDAISKDEIFQMDIEYRLGINAETKA